MANITGTNNAYSSALNLLKSAPMNDGGSDGVAFADLLKTSLQNAADAQHKSEKVSGEAIAGKADMTDVLQAVTNAELALNTVLAIRDKAVQAYEQIMRTPV
jgi:flagellar hook-basal body complex protein FliE